jgi:acyl-CoA thioesterase I
MPSKIKNILCFGDSLTAGYGLSSSQAYPALIQQKINAMNLPYRVINAGVNGDTSSRGAQRIQQFLDQPIDVLVLELGINDLFRGIFPPQTSTNLQEIIDKVRAANPRCRMVMAGMELPTAMVPPELSGFLAAPLIAAFQNLFGEIARKNNMAYIPFLLKGVAGNAQLNLHDRIHPNAAGQKLLAENVWDVLSAIL